MSDWQDHFERRLEEWPRLSVVLLIAGVVVGVFVPSWVAAGARAAGDWEKKQEADEKKQEADSKAIKRHVQWLRAMSVDEKIKWPTKTVCHPASAPRGECECKNWDDSIVTFPERLPNGDVACHETR